MKRPLTMTVAIAGVAGAIAIPSIVLGNARRTEGTLAAQQLAETPFIAQLTGANEVPAGDPDGAGTATVSFGQLDTDTYEVCWDIVYTGIATPTGAHIHAGAAGQSNPTPLIGFPNPTPDAFSGCTEAPATDVEPILANPANFYVNVHTGEFPNGAIRGQLAKGPEPAGAMHFLPAPLRAYDSREATAGILAASSTRTISLARGEDPAGASVVAVPPGATAAIVTLTATQTGGPGFLTIYSDAVTSVPATSNLNFTTAGLSVAVSTQVAVDAAGEIKVTAGPANTHFIVDVVGYLY